MSDKPKLSIRKNEGIKSIIKRAKSKVLEKDRKILNQIIDLHSLHGNDGCLMLDLAQIFEVEYK